MDKVARPVSRPRRDGRDLALKEPEPEQHSADEVSGDRQIQA